jgi:hypothetical protein
MEGFGVNLTPNVGKKEGVRGRVIDTGEVLCIPEANGSGSSRA